MNGIPSHFILEILANCSAKHLKVLEGNNEDIKELTLPLWRNLIVKDFTGAKFEECIDYRSKYDELQNLELEKQERLKFRLNIISKEEEAKKCRGVKVLDKKPRISIKRSTSSVQKKSKWQKLLAPGSKPKFINGSQYMG